MGGERVRVAVKGLGLQGIWEGGRERVRVGSGLGDLWECGFG